MILRSLDAAFVHVPKTGGTSIERTLLTHLGYPAVPARKLPADVRAALAIGPNGDPKRGPASLGHLRARDYVILGHLTPDEWERSTTFAVIRNPYDRIASEYRYRRTAQGPTFREWIFDCFPEPSWSDEYDHVRTQYEYLHDENGRLLVDHVLRLEQIDNDWAALAARIGAPRSLPHQNPSARSARPRHLREIDHLRRLCLGAGYDFPYCRHTRAFVRERYADDFRAYGYDT